jgi:hypothetical protein
MEERRVIGPMQRRSGISVKKNDNLPGIACLGLPSDAPALSIAPRNQTRAIGFRFQAARITPPWMKNQLILINVSCHQQNGEKNDEGDDPLSHATKEGHYRQAKGFPHSFHLENSTGGIESVSFAESAMKSALPFLAVLISGVITLSAQDSGGALAALNALPQKYRDGVLKLSADNGTPNPPQWYITALNSDASNTIHSIIITDGQITSEKLSLDLRSAMQNSPLNLGAIRIGSTEAWNAAAGYCRGKGKTLSSVSYVLQQQGKDATPLWSIWCYDKGGSYIGFLKLLATTGTVISSD